MRIHAAALALSGLALLSGCQTLPSNPEDAVRAIRLNQPLTVPAGSASVRLQAGKAVAMNAVQDFDPYCTLELDTVRDTPQQVAPDTFEVTSVQQRIQDFAGMPVMPFVGLLGPFSSGGPSQVYYVTEFRLKSATDPRIRSLACESNQIGIPVTMQRFLTDAEIDHAVGGYFSFKRAR